MRRLAIETNNLTACKARMKFHGAKVRDDVEDGHKVHDLAIFERGNISVKQDVVTGVYYFMILVDRPLTLPPVDSPNYTIAWDSDVLVNVGTEEEPDMQNHPKPKYNVHSYDDNNELNGNRLQEIGWI